MSDKRFERWNDCSCKVKDNQENTLWDWEDVVDLLNEQQATISALKEENEQLMIENAKLKNVITELKDMEKSIKSERFYIHCGDDINKQLMDTESDFNIHVEEIGSDEELIRLCNLLNKQQATINKLEQENRQLRQFINKGRRLSVKELMANTNENELLKKKIKELESENEDLREVNKETVKQCERWKNLYELKDAEVTARVDALNKVCEYYTSEVLFKSDVDPNKAVKEVINEILNTPIYEEG